MQRQRIKCMGVGEENESIQVWMLWTSLEMEFIYLIALNQIAKYVMVCKLRDCKIDLYDVVNKIDLTFLKKKKMFSELRMRRRERWRSLKVKAKTNEKRKIFYCHWKKKLKKSKWTKYKLHCKSLSALCI